MFRDYISPRWTLTGERRNMKEVAGLGDVILEQVPVLIQYLSNDFSYPEPSSNSSLSAYTSVSCPPVS